MREAVASGKTEVTGSGEPSGRQEMTSSPPHFLISSFPHFLAS
jgi:hypothetical protein